MMKKEWFPIVSEFSLSKGTEQDIGGVRCRTMPSPYDVPQAVRAFLADRGHTAVIEFQYLTDEPLREERLNNVMVREVGCNSGRVYRIKAEVEAGREVLITEPMRKAFIEGLAHAGFKNTSPRPKLAPTSVDATRTALLRNANRLAEHLCQAEDASPLSTADTDSSPNPPRPFWGSYGP